MGSTEKATKLITCPELMAVCCKSGSTVWRDGRSPGAPMGRGMTSTGGVAPSGRCVMMDGVWFVLEPPPIQEGQF